MSVGSGRVSGCFGHGFQFFLYIIIRYLGRCVCGFCVLCLVVGKASKSVLQTDSDTVQGRECKG